MARWYGISVLVGAMSVGCSGGAAGQSQDALGSQPELLSGSGLFDDITQDSTAEGVLPFEPRFPLWSDGAAKRRWIRLPEGETVDTSDPDHWVFPVGTRLWKEFVRDGVRVETRLLEKIGEGDWFAMPYAWQEDGKDAVATPEGANDVQGTLHDIPPSTECATCHAGSPDFVLGFSALQLGHEGKGATLRSLAQEQKLSPPPSSPLVELPGDSTAQAALGYMHANCGACHNPTSPVAGWVGMDLWLHLGDLASVKTTGTYRTAVLGGRIAAGDPDGSFLVARMSVREPGMQMPPLGTEVVDEHGLGAVRAWIQGLAGTP